MTLAIAQRAVRHALERAGWTTMDAARAVCRRLGLSGTRHIVEATVAIGSLQQGRLPEGRTDREVVLLAHEVAIASAEARVGDAGREALRWWLIEGAALPEAE